MLLNILKSVTIDRRGPCSASVFQPPINSTPEVLFTCTSVVLDLTRLCFDAAGRPNAAACATSTTDRAVKGLGRARVKSFPEKVTHRM